MWLKRVLRIILLLVVFIWNFKLWSRRVTPMFGILKVLNILIRFIILRLIGLAGRMRAAVVGRVG